MTKVAIGMVVLAIASAGAGPAVAQQDHGAQEAHTGRVQALSAPLREALSQEMVHLQGGMQTIVPAFVAGDWPLVARTAKHMEQSYIMKQELSAEQLDELHHALPAEFLALDAEFHYLAGMLSHAAENRKAELAAFYFSRMLESCNACHSRFALEKFPALARPDDPPAHEHHHH